MPTTKRKKPMRLTKSEVERRETAILKWFQSNPTATGDAMNKALATGKVTGRDGEKMLNIKRVYALRTKARELVAAAAVPAGVPAQEFSAQRNFDEQAKLDEPTRKHLRGLLTDLRHLPEDVLSLTVRRDGSATVGRQVQLEQPYNLDGAVVNTLKSATDGEL